MPFNTQLFNDGYDDGPGFDDVYDGDSIGAPDANAGEQDLLAATAGQTHCVRLSIMQNRRSASMRGNLRTTSGKDLIL
jgi:condensin complex subunit 2